MTTAAELLERERELAALDAALRAAADGSGAVLVVAGEAGAGKSHLLRAAAARARELGLTVLHAAGGELERDFAFGVARQLFEPVADAAALAGAAAPAAALLGQAAGAAGAAGEGRGYELVHALYWLTANLSAGAPLAVLVDDAQWADPDSLRLLVHLARRIDELSVALLLAVREGDSEPAGGPLDALRAAPGVVELTPAPLGDAALAELTRRELGEAPAPAFVAACAAATRGNPFLARALLDELASERVRPTAAAAERVRAASPVSVQRSVLLRLARLGPAAVGLAQAVAIFDTDAALADAAALAGLDAPAAQAAADALIGARVLEAAHPLRFVHPLVQAAIYADMGLARRADGHRRAAELLDARAPDRAVGHLLATHPAADPWVFVRLRAGARRALDRGALEAARALLERALAEAPAPADQAATLLSLGRAERLAGAPDPRRLERALELAAGPELRAEIVRELFDLRSQQGDDAAARALLAYAQAELPDPTGSSWLELEATRVAFMQVAASPAELATLARRLEAAADETRAGRRRLALLAFHRLIWVQTTAPAVAALAERAVAGGRLIEQEGPGHPATVSALSVLMGVERVDEVGRLLEAALDTAQRRGAAADAAGALVLRARLALFCGRPRDAEADARASLAFTEAAGLRAAAELALAALVNALVQRGELEPAEAELGARPLPTNRSGTLYVLLQARAALRTAQARPAEALEDLRAAQRLRWGPGGGSIHARAALVEAMSAVKAEGARELAAGAVADAERWGLPSALGLALRAQGLAERGDTGLALLARAAETLAGTPRRLEAARALVELGAARRRANRRADAREPLEAGMELAHRCGAVGLAERARQELVACGARPRKLVRTGADALTASELRVAHLAVRGHTNREIAQTLFVTRKTVETHLAAIYRKLDVSDRAHLAPLLAPEDQGPPPEAKPRPRVGASVT